MVKIANLFIETSGHNAIRVILWQSHLITLAFDSSQKFFRDPIAQPVSTIYRATHSLPKFTAIRIATNQFTPFIIKMWP
ncbi:hypothetical protein HMPREF3198_00262 [Winkia neuii]|nr:hypothetical protein HMPREF3198_00262 [Winkia neuii]